MSADPLHRAKTYPYPIPERSYIFRNGRPDFLNADSPPPDLQNRTPVLAVGSNQSPEQLARKFGAAAADGTPGGNWGDIPVIRIQLRDFDAVYSPHISTYGAVPATLHEAPGVTVSLFITWLSQPQLTRMHDTEITSANYDFGRLGGLSMEAEHGPEMDAFYLYISTRGSFTHNGVPVPLAEIKATGRRWPAMNQDEVQDTVRGRLAPDMAKEAFISQSIENADLRRHRSDTLGINAHAFAPPRLEKIPI